MMIKYNNLKVGDVVITGGVGVFGRLIRGVSKGWDARRKRRTVATHVGVVIEWEGQKLMAEMLGDGLNISSLKRYTNKRRRFILDVVRFEELTDEGRELIQARVARDFRNGLDYDWAGVASFVARRVKHAPHEYFCSEYTAFLLNKIGGVWIDKEHHRIFPSDFQNAGEELHAKTKGVEYV